MQRFSQVKEILDGSIGKPEIGAHGTFWRSLDLAAFKAKQVYGQQLVVPGSSEQSNLILALRGHAPFGSDIGTPNARYRRMPAGMPAVPDDQIAFIARWIDDGCPDDGAGT